MSRVLVTGADGFLGRWVTRELRRREHLVLAPERYTLNLLRADVAVGGVQDLAPEVIVHLAARCGGIGLNREQPASLLRENTLMGLNVLEAARFAHVRRVVMLGSTCSYPRDCPVPFKEETLWDGYPEATNAPYGVAKRLLLTAAQAYRQQHGLDAVTLVPTNLYGPEDHFDPARSHVIPALIKRFDDARKAGQRRVELWGDGTPTRDFLFVADCAAAVAYAVDEPDLGPAPVNLGSGVEVSMAALAEEVAALVGYDGEVAWDPSQPGGQPRRCLDTTQAALRLGWRALVSLTEGLARTVTWYHATGGRP